MQESYREGGSVRTRTVEYFGAMEPAVAAQVQATRKQLGQADMTALVQSVREATTATTRAPEKPRETQEPPTAPEATPERYKRMTVNGRPQLVDTRTGELIEPQDKKVITTKNPTLRPFSESLKLPLKIEAHKLSRAALHGTHRKFGERLKAMQINPATMPDVVIKYGHPDGLKQHRNGSYVVTASRTPKRGHSLNKTRLWQNYRHALSRATIDAIESERPEAFAMLQSQLSDSHKEGRRLLFEHIAQTTSGVEHLGLSLQLLIWDKVPTAKGVNRAEDLGQLSRNTAKNWHSEAALILAEVHKNGWQGLIERTTKTTNKHKAGITKKRGQIDRLSSLEILAGKRRKILREIMATETKLKASQQLAERVRIVRDCLEPKPRQKLPWKIMNKLRRKIRRATGGEVPDDRVFATWDYETSSLVYNAKISGYHFIFDSSGNEIKRKRHKD